jgi:hypothetical protein
MESEGNDSILKFDTDDDEDDEDHVPNDSKKSQSDPLCLFTTGLGFSADDKTEMMAWNLPFNYVISEAGS